MAWNTPSPPKPPGEWDSFSAGMDYKAWTLDCGSLFHVHIVNTQGEYWTQFNGCALPRTKHLKDARLAAEREIVRRVREMLPAYRAIFARYETQKGAANMTEERAMTQTFQK